MLCAGLSGNGNSMVQTMSSWECGRESTEQSKWERLAAVVDSGAAENVFPVDACSHVKLSSTHRSETGMGFRGAGGERNRNHGQRKFKVRMTDGHVAGSTWQVADVQRPLMTVAKMVAAGNRVHFDSKDPRVVSQKRRNQQEARFSLAGLSPGVCVTDEGQTIRPVRSEGLARECKLVRCGMDCVRRLMHGGLFIGQGTVKGHSRRAATVTFTKLLLAAGHRRISFVQLPLDSLRQKAGLPLPRSAGTCSKNNLLRKKPLAFDRNRLEHFPPPSTVQNFVSTLNGALGRRKGCRGEGPPKQVGAGHNVGK